jgi:hypothetical protein
LKKRIEELEEELHSIPSNRPPMLLAEPEPIEFKDDPKWNAMRRQSDFRISTELAVHDAMLRAQGLDPNIIGATEVPPVLCPHCSEALPWSLLIR